ncbi:hypothetical protein ACJ8S7_005102 [Klebsiella pneumoniae]|nr:hypothetical protein [Klebsiella pneumoniae]
MRNVNLSDKRYLAALERIKVLIVDGLPLKGYDDTTVGCKNTECSWGLCAQTKQHWPDKEDYLWPEQPNRISPKYTKEYQACPMDKRENPTLNGCFYTCRFFNKGKNPTRDEAIALYDYRINRIKKRMK